MSADDLRRYLRVLRGITVAWLIVGSFNGAMAIVNLVHGRPALTAVEIAVIAGLAVMHRFLIRPRKVSLRRRISAASAREVGLRIDELEKELGIS
jgi:hypothetical protein